MQKSRSALISIIVLIGTIGFPSAQSENLKIPREVGTSWEYAIHIDWYEYAGNKLDTNSDDSSTYLTYITKDTVFDFRSEVAVIGQTESADSTFLTVQIKNFGTRFTRWETKPYTPAEQHSPKPTIVQALPDIDTVFQETLSFAKSNHICSTLPKVRQKTLRSIFDDTHPFSSPFFSSYFLETCQNNTWQGGDYWKIFDPNDYSDSEDSNNYEIWRDSKGLLYKSASYRTTSYKVVGLYEKRRFGFAELKRFNGTAVDTTEWRTANAKIESVPHNSVKLESVCEGSYYRTNNPFLPTPLYAKPEVSISPLPSGMSFHPNRQPFYQWSGFIAFGAPDWSYQIFSKYPLRTDTTSTKVTLLRNRASKLILDSAIVGQPYVFSYFQKEDSSACKYNPTYAYGSLPSWLHPVRKFSRFDTSKLDINNLPDYNYWERQFSVSGSPPEKKDFEFQAIACLDSIWAQSYFFSGTLSSTYQCSILDTSIIRVKMIEGNPVVSENKPFNRIAFVDGGAAIRIQSEISGIAMIVFRDIRGKILDSEKYPVSPGENNLTYSHRLPNGLIIMSIYSPGHSSRNLVLNTK